ncbi:ThiF family adenylyltransferase [soil metagenome]
MSSSLKVREVFALPPIPEEDSVYKLLPYGRGERYYRERTDRNIGWITPREQDRLRHSVVGIAGCGGMGGLLAAIFARLGIGEIRIADCEVFDVSNLNRQFAATSSTIGSSKAFETARMVRAITDDMTLAVYPQGITEKTVDQFLDGCDIVCDEIEFWALGARILLHERACQVPIPLVNCSTVGFGTRLFLFDHTGMTMEEMVGISLGNAYVLQERISNRTATHQEIQRVLFAMLNGLIPELPEYHHCNSPYLSRDECMRRLRDECTAPIIATNPSLASGFLANHVLLTLLSGSDGVQSTRSIVRPPRTPGYLYFDSALMQAKVVLREEVSNAYLN